MRSLFGIQILPHTNEVVDARPNGEQNGQPARQVGQGDVDDPPRGEQFPQGGDGVEGRLDEYGADEDDLHDGLNLTQQVVTEVKRFFPKKVYSTTIPRNVRLSEAPSFGQPIMYFDKNSKGSIAYAALCDEFLSQQK